MRSTKLDLTLACAIAMLVVWAALTFVVNDAPGITHILLIAGVSLLIWGVVKRDATPGPGTPPRP